MKEGDVQSNNVYVEMKEEKKEEIKEEVKAPPQITWPIWYSTE